MIVLAITKCTTILFMMDDSLALKLARHLKRLRGEQTQRAFARKLGISQTTLNHLEQAKDNVTLKTVQIVCNRLKCSIGSLFEDP